MRRQEHPKQISKLKWTWEFSFANFQWVVCSGLSHCRSIKDCWSSESIQAYDAQKQYHAKGWQRLVEVRCFDGLDEHEDELAGLLLFGRSRWKCSHWIGWRDPTFATYSAVLIVPWDDHLHLKGAGKKRRKAGRLHTHASRLYFCRADVSLSPCSFSGQIMVTGEVAEVCWRRSRALGLMLLCC